MQGHLRAVTTDDHRLILDSDLHVSTHRHHSTIRWHCERPTTGGRHWVKYHHITREWHQITSDMIHVNLIFVDEFHEKQENMCMARWSPSYAYWCKWQRQILFWRKIHGPHVYRSRDSTLLVQGSISCVSYYYYYLLILHRFNAS